jgi:hypothetical protein
MVGIVTATTLVALPISAQAKSEATGLQKHFQEDSSYRNRYIAGWSFFWLLIIIGLFILLNPRQKGPEAH